jgi:hypothetical protein
MSFAQPVDSGAGIIGLANAVAPCAVTVINAPEIEAQRRTAVITECLSHPVHHLIVHGAAIQRVRVTDDDGRLSRIAIIMDCLQSPDGAGKE